MPMPSPNQGRIETIASGLGDLLSEVVFVGGSVVEFYVTDPVCAARMVGKPGS